MVGLDQRGFNMTKEQLTQWVVNELDKIREALNAQDESIRPDFISLLGDGENTHVIGAYKDANIPTLLMSASYAIAKRMIEE